MEARNVREFNEMVEEVQQQFICYKEKADKKFQKIEDLLALAAHKMEILTKLKMLKKKRNQNPFAKTLAIENRKEDSLHHLRLQLPELEGPEISECLQDCEHQVDDFGIGYKTGEWPNLEEEANENAACTGEPIYDEEQGEGQDFCWPEQKFILEALNGSNSNSSELLKSEIFTTERPEANEDLSYTQAIQDRNTPSPLQKIKPIQLREIFSIIPARRETFEAFLSRRIVKDFLTAEIPHNLSMASSKFGKKNVMLIFDPGGYESADAFKMVKEMLGLDEKLVEVAIIISTCDRLEQLQDQDIQKVCERTDRFDKIISEVNQQYVDSMRTLMTVLPFQYKSMVLEQGRPETDNSTRSEYHEVSRIKVTIHIFDPGGDQYTSCKVETARWKL